MQYRIKSPTGDFTFGNGSANYYNNVPAAVGQAVQTRLQLFVGEWFLDTTAGTPYLGGVLGKVLQATADSTIQTVALGTTTDDGSTIAVTDISSFTSSVDTTNRGYSCEFAIDTIYGPTAVQIANYQNY